MLVYVGVPTLIYLMSEEYNIRAVVCTQKEPDLERLYPPNYVSAQTRLRGRRSMML